MTVRHRSNGASRLTVGTRGTYKMSMLTNLLQKGWYFTLLT